MGTRPPAPDDHMVLTGLLRGSADLGSGALAQVGEVDVFVAEIDP